MPIITSDSDARRNFDSLCDRAVDDRETVIIRRQDKSDVALVSAEELSSLIETAYLLRSPKNAERLMTALDRAESQSLKPTALDDLRRELIGND